MTKTAKVVKFSDGECYEYEAALWQNAIDEKRATLITGKEGAKALEDYRRAELLELIKPNATLTAVYTGGTQSSARYKVFIIATAKHDGSTYIRDITRMVGKFVGFRLSKSDEIVQGGWGFSKSFQIGYSLGCMLWPNGTPEPHGTRNGEPDSNGGYAINVNAH